MSLWKDISDFYLDGNGLVSPNPVKPGNKRASDNGPCYTAEYLCMDASPDIWMHMDLVTCINKRTGLLQRAPVSQGITEQEGPDDYYAVLNWFKRCDNTEGPRGFLKAVFRYLGALNNVDPGHWTSQSFLIRQPQLLAAMVTAAFPSLLNPLHWLARLATFPLYAWSSLVIATSCTYRIKTVDGQFSGFERVPTNATDERRLSWHLVQTVKDRSLLCYLASKLWYRRLYKDYGPTGMRAVAAIYYIGRAANEPHPFALYWVD